MTHCLTAAWSLLRQAAGDDPGVLMRSFFTGVACGGLGASFGLGFFLLALAWPSKLLALMRAAHRFEGRLKFGRRDECI